MRHSARSMEVEFAPGQSDVRAKSDPSGIGVRALIPTGKEKSPQRYAGDR